MATSNYDVHAKLVLDSKKGQGQLNTAAKQSKRLKQELHGATSAASGLWSKVVGIGAAYLGLNAGINMFSQLTRGAVRYTASLEGMSIGLTSVLAAVEGSGWDKAAKRSAIAFEELKNAAVASPAGPEELFGIFQGIVGPIENAGFSMQKVLDITTDTVSAASALNVDFQQAQRDISLMVRGAAGMDVKLFSLLRSTGAITEETEEWNKKLTQAERVEKLADALSRFRSAGDKYSKSWTGVTRTFGGIVQEFGRAGISPIMDTISGKLDTFNDYLLANRVEIEATLRATGERAAESLNKVIDSGVSGLKYVSSHWDEIIGKMTDVVGAMRTMAPIMAAMYGGNALVQASGGYGMIGGGDKGKKGKGGAIASAFEGMSDDEMAGQGFRKNKSGKWINSAGKFVAGAGSAGAGAALASGGGAGAASGAAATAAALSGPLVLALAAVGAVAAFASDHFESFSQIWTNATEGMGTELMALWEALKSAFLPLLKSWGGVIAAILVPAFQALVLVFRLLVRGLTLILEVMGAVYGYIYKQLEPAFNLVVDFLVLLGEGLQKLGGILGLEVGRIRDLAKDDPEGHKYEGGFDQWMKEHQGFMDKRINGDPDQQRINELHRVPGGRTSVTNDFRGSKISIKQDFKGKHDPDRIVQAMMTDLTRQAEMRISSGYSSALSR